MNKILIALALIIAAAAGYWLVRSGYPASNEGQPSPSVSREIAPTSQNITIAVKAENFKFTPSEIKVKKGDRITIALENIEGFHDFMLDEFGARTERINAEAKTSVSFTADKTGTFEYYCSVGNHRQMGMKGNLIVE